MNTSRLLAFAALCLLAPGVALAGPVPHCRVCKINSALHLVGKIEPKKPGRVALPNWSKATLKLRFTRGTCAPLDFGLKNEVLTNQSFDVDLSAKLTAHCGKAVSPGSILNATLEVERPGEKHTLGPLPVDK